MCLPEGYLPDPACLEFAKAYGDKFQLVTDPMEAAKDADVILTDVWASMGEEGEAEARRKVFEGVYQVNDALMQQAHSDCMVLHCLPAHRGEEITDLFLKLMPMRFLMRQKIVFMHKKL